MEFISKGVKNKQLKAIYKGEVKNWKDVGDPEVNSNCKCATRLHMLHWSTPTYSQL